MKLLLDTHLLLWAATASARLPESARTLIEDKTNDLFFSAASIWEVAIKSSLRREDFQLDASILRRGLLENGYFELDITGQQATAVAHLAPHHKDPFDRLLLSQAAHEGLLLLTSDKLLAEYAGPIQLV